MRNAFPAFLIGLLVGAGLGFAMFNLLASDAAGVDPPALQVADSTIAAAASHSESVNLAQPEEASATRQRSVPSEFSPSVSQAEARDLLARAAPARAVKNAGSGALSGRVVDPNGDPIAGVTVRVVGQAASTPRRGTDPTGIGGEAPVRRSLVERVRDLAEREGRSRALTRTTQTQADGTWRCAGLPEDPTWSVSAYKKDWVLTSKTRRNRSLAVGSKVDFEGHPVIELHVSITLPDGSQPTEAVLSCAQKYGNGQTRNTYAWSPASPKLRLTAGDYEIKALSGNAIQGQTGSGAQREFNSEEQSITLTVGVEPAVLALQLAGRCGVQGSLTYAGEEPEDAHPRVHLVRLGPEEVFDPERARSEEESENYSDPSSYIFLDLQPGTYVVWAAHNYGADVAATYQVVEVGEGVAECNLEFPPIDASRSIAVSARGPDGESVPDLGFRWNYESGNRSSSSGMDSALLVDGVYYLGVPQESRKSYYDGASGDSFTLTVTSGKFGNREIELTAGQSAVSVQFVAPGSLTVHVTGADRVVQPAELHVYLGKTATGASHTTSTTGTDKGGRHVFKGVEPGSYEVRLSLSREDYSARNYVEGTILTQHLEIRAGENEISLDVPLLYDLSIRIPKDKPQRGSISLSTLGLLEGQRGVTGRIRTDKEELVVLKNVPAGRYMLGNGMSSMEIQVPRGEVLYEPKETNAFRVTISDPGGLMGKAGFRTGDVVIGIGDKDFDGPGGISQIQRVMLEEVELTVLRGNKRVTIKFGPIDQSAANDMGGRLDPMTR